VYKLYIFYSCALMEKLVLSDNLFVIQVEMDLYSMLKKVICLSSKCARVVYICLLISGLK